jgi:hypothetical protein
MILMACVGRAQGGGPRVPRAYHATNASPDSRRLVMGEVTQDAFLGGTRPLPGPPGGVQPSMPESGRLAYSWTDQPPQAHLPEGPQGAKGQVCRGQPLC